MHRELGGDFLVGQIVEPFQERAVLAAVEDNGAVPTVSFRPSFASVTPIVVSRAAPDVLQPFLAGHRPDRATFPLDDSHAHMLDGGAVGQIAIAMEKADGPSMRKVKNTDVTEPVRYSRMAKIDPRVQSGGRISNI